MRVRATGIAVAASLAACLLFSSCYEISEGTKYLSLLSKAVSLERALADPKTNPESRLLIERAIRARDFAQGELGLKRTKNYTTIVEMKAETLAYIVQACGELTFDRYLWSYPLVGKMPYRGFFDRKDAEKEAERLRKQGGLDVIVRPADAFSTLGWFADPLFSFMSSYSEAEVADLVIHEMTHATIFLKGSGVGAGAEQFNEELATFVGEKGSLLYLAAKYGPDSPEIAKARADRADSAAFAAYLAGTGAELEAVYASSSSDVEKRKRKAEIIAERAEEFKKESALIFKGESYRDFRMDKIDNAYIDLYRLYRGESSLYRDFYAKRCGSDMGVFIRTIGDIVRAKIDPKSEMRRLLAQGESPR